MSRFYNWVGKVFTKKTTIFGMEFFNLNLVLIVLFFILSIINTFNFIMMLIASVFYPALIQLFLFTCNTGFLYWYWMSNKMKIIISKNKI